MPYGRLCLLFFAFFLRMGSCFLKQLMDSLSSSASTVPSIDDYFPKIEIVLCSPIGSIVFPVHLTRIFVSFVILLSAFFLVMGSLFSGTSNGKLFLICLYRAEF